MSNPSITFWSRLEPRPRASDLTNALSARVRDAAWLLARQWQLGEYLGEDAGSPAYMKIDTHLASIGAWAPTTGTDQAVTASCPIERDVLREPFSLDDVSLRVELGQRWERHLVKAGAAAHIGDTRTAWPIPASPNQDDPASARQRAVWRFRAVDGMALYLAMTSTTPPTLPSIPTLPGPLVGPVTAEMNDFVAQVRADYGGFGATDPSTWDPSRLEYGLRAFSNHPVAGNVILFGTPDSSGNLEWFAFDAITGSLPSTGLPPATHPPTQTLIPAPVRFRGMPNARFWDFEDGRVDFGNVVPDKKDLATMILMDFMLVHGNDWFVLPFSMPAGALCKAAIEVHDVFGSPPFSVPRADSVAGPRWTMFSITSGAGLADYYVQPASSAATRIDGAPIEEIRLLRDEQANMVWGIERATESNLGVPLLGADRATSTVTQPGSSAPLRYQIQSPVPPHWIPFQPAALGTGDQIVLERSVLLDPVAGPSSEWATLFPSARGKILRPSLPSGTPYRVREEEVPREGTQVRRIVRFSRCSDGTPRIWVMRQRNIGTGEGIAGLKYDLSMAVEPGDP